MCIILKQGTPYHLWVWYLALLFIFYQSYYFYLGDFGSKFWFIIEGLVEVILENKDYKYYELNNANEFYDK